MDLPISRIARTKVIAEANGNIRLHDEVYDNDLLVLSDSVEEGRYVVCLSYHIGGGETINKLMSVESRYDFETLSRRPLLRDINNRLIKEGYTVHHIGLYYKRGKSTYVGKQSIYTEIDDSTYETIYSTLPDAA